jgi:hypothetical protein
MVDESMCWLLEVFHGRWVAVVRRSPRLSRSWLPRVQDDKTAAACAMAWNRLRRPSVSLWWIYRLWPRVYIGISSDKIYRVRVELLLAWAGSRVGYGFLGRGERERSDEPVQYIYLPVVVFVILTKGGIPKNWEKPFCFYY